MRRLAVAICLGLGLGLGLGAGVARAGPIDTTLCPGGPEATSFGLAKIVGGPKVYLTICPVGIVCAAQAHIPYVIPGDVVIVGPRLADGVCVAKPNREGDTAGWVTERQIEPLPVPAASRWAWVGHWEEGGGDTIDLKAKGAGLVVDGQACWPGCETPPDQQTGGPNVGNLDGEATPRGGRLKLGDSDDDCKAELWLVGAYLVVFDNLNCGGMNVSFTGVYRRTRGR